MQPNTKKATEVGRQFALSYRIIELSIGSFSVFIASASKSIGNMLKIWLSVDNVNV